ncbi:hypothetical protein PN497_03565 [Sphaerospermopsis kisseleviana CS-549]|uniref:Uncharacterized protein n=2 Tax=Sphaerospermopsis TaxID=752201 RepID=A0A480A1R5_9CYAN|nr:MULTISPECIES: hypothetical protein [Sphaerospermopsis]MBD2134996.1 hypothetical protein [Sphaerospermopsis sp. FACHB-1094]MDB9440451.1 hypothetical protein [Sphaerospermopsis kisseleviana CS-549]BAZ79663.1 hypothetical protein NIES73_09080 [Sphaerospermopsis kisseleviana NIES-73]GCL37271.1 hypothetical protein SR1949_23790 [Sphaerospermopsis reniformis]
MKNEIVIVRTGIPPQQLDKYVDDETKLHEAPEGLRTLAILGKTFYWTLNLERVQSCAEVHIYNWEGNQRIVAPILPEQCYSIDMFGKSRTIIAFDTKAVRFENVDPPRKFGRSSAFYE